MIGVEVAIELPPQSDQVELQGELEWLSGHRHATFTSGSRSARLSSATLGVTDVTARDPTSKDVQFTARQIVRNLLPGRP